MLSDLPGAVAEQLSTESTLEKGSLVFEPEISPREVATLENRFAYLQKVCAQVDELQRYADDIFQLRSDFGLSMM